MMKHRNSSSDSNTGLQDGVENIRTKPAHIYDNITRKLLRLGITLSVTTFVGLIVRYAVQEFDPTVNTITVTTARVNNRDIASLSVSKNFLERILEFIEESISITAAIIPLGFPLCTLFNRYFAKVRLGGRPAFQITSDRVLEMIPKYVVIGDSLALHLPDSGSAAEEASTQSGAEPSGASEHQQHHSPSAGNLRPLVRDTIYHLIRARLKPKLIVEDSYEEARRLGIRIGLIKRDHHKLAVIKSVDLLRNITDSRGDIKQGKVRYLLSRMKIMSQATPADKSLLVYLIKHCEPLPNENLAYLGYTFTDPEAMRLADCALTFADCDEEDVKRSAQVIMDQTPQLPGGSFTDLYLFVVVCLISSNIRQSYALYQVSASVACCIYRFLSLTVFQEQLISHSQFSLLVIMQQLFAILGLMTKWLSSLAQAPLTPAHLGPASSTGTLERRRQAAQGARSMSSISVNGTGNSHHHRQQQQQHHHHHHHHHNHQRSSSSSLAALNLAPPQPPGQTLATGPAGAAQVAIQMQPMRGDDTLGSSSSLEADLSLLHEPANQLTPGQRRRSDAHRSPSIPAGSRQSTPHRRRHNQASPSNNHTSESHIQLTGTDLDLSVINSKLATTYKQTFHNSSLIDDVTYRLAKLHIAYQVLVMIVIMIFGNAMFQLNANNNRQHQTLALNSLIMINVFSLASCFNQFGEFNLSSGLRNHPFFVCVLLLAVALQVCLTELNAFGLENLNPLQWFVCFVFALMSALIAPLTGQQARQRPVPLDHHAQQQHQHHNHQHQHQHHHHSDANRKPTNPYLAGSRRAHHISGSQVSSPAKVHPRAGASYGDSSDANIS